MGGDVGVRAGSDRQRMTTGGKQLTDMDRYERLRVLGRGSHGVAMLARRRSIVGSASSEEPLRVVKEIDLSLMSHAARREAHTEAEVLRSLSHVNVVRLVETFLETDRLCIVMEYADGGDLAAVMRQQQSSGCLFAEGDVMATFVQCCLGLQHAHSKRILHRDIKSQNIFLTQAGTVKLGDFGIAKVLDYTTAKADTCVGTPCYASPEVIDSRPYGLKADIWSLGVVLFELLALEQPFSAHNLAALVLRIVLSDPKPLPESSSADARDLVQRLLRKDPEQRPTCDELLALDAMRAAVASLPTQPPVRMLTAAAAAAPAAAAAREDHELPVSAALPQRGVVGDVSAASGNGVDGSVEIPRMRCWTPETPPTLPGSEFSGFEDSTRDADTGGVVDVGCKAEGVGDNEGVDEGNGDRGAEEGKDNLVAEAVEAPVGTDAEPAGNPPTLAASSAEALYATNDDRSSMSVKTPSRSLAEERDDSGHSALSMAMFKTAKPAAQLPPPPPPPPPPFAPPLERKFVRKEGFERSADAADIVDRLLGQLDSPRREEALSGSLEMTQIGASLTSTRRRRRRYNRAITDEARIFLLQEDALETELQCLAERQALLEEGRVAEALLREKSKQDVGAPSMQTQRPRQWVHDERLPESCQSSKEPTTWTQVEDRGACEADATGCIANDIKIGMSTDVKGFSTSALGLTLDAMVRLLSSEVNTTMKLRPPPPPSPTAPCPLAPLVDFPSVDSASVDTAAPEASAAARSALPATAAAADSTVGPSPCEAPQQRKSPPQRKVAREGLGPHPPTRRRAASGGAVPHGSPVAAAAPPTPYATSSPTLSVAAPTPQSYRSGGPVVPRRFRANCPTTAAAAAAAGAVAASGTSAHSPPMGLGRWAVAAASPGTAVMPSPTLTRAAAGSAPPSAGCASPPATAAAAARAARCHVGSAAVGLQRMGSPAAIGAAVRRARGPLVRAFS